MWIVTGLWGGLQLQVVDVVIFMLLAAGALK